LIKFLQIKNIIPKKRCINTFILLTLSSLIFASSLSLLYDLNNVDAEYFGSGKNEVIVSNPLASTPFTSTVPEILKVSLSRFNGVINTSAEVLQPSVVENHPIYVRGVDYDVLSLFDQSINLSGESDNFEGNNAIIGENLAKRINAVVGQSITTESITTKKSITVTIIGVVSSDVHNDELLIPLNLAKYYANLDVTKVGYVRVKYDPEITTSQNIIDFAARENELKIRVDLGNATIDLQSYRIAIYTGEDAIPEISTLIEEINYFYLPTAIYRIDITQFGLPIANLSGKYVELYDDGEINLSLNNYIFEVHINFVFYNTKLPEFSFTINFNNDTEDREFYTDLTGEITLLLTTGNYQIEYNWLNIIHTYDLNVSRSFKHSIFISTSSNFPYVDLQNGSIYSSNIFQKEVYNYNEFVLIEINEEQIIPQFHEQKSVLSKILVDGDYILGIKNKQTNSLIFSVAFIIDSNIKIEFPDIVNYGVYEPMYILPVNRSIFNIEKSIINIKDTISIPITTESDEIYLPNVLGFYHIELQLWLWNDTIINMVSDIIIDDTNRFAGFIAPNQEIIWKYGDSTEIWFKEQPLNTTDYTVYLTSKFSGILIPNYSPEVWLNLNEIILEFTEFSVILPFKPTIDYSDHLIILDHTTTLMNQNNSYVTSSMEFLFDPHQISVSMEINNSLINITSEHAYSVFNQEYNATINVYNHNTKSTYHFFLILKDETNTLDQGILLDGFKLHLYDGVMIQTYHGGSVDLFHENGSLIEQFTNTSSYKFVRLPPGNYYASIYLDNDTNYSFTILAYVSELSHVTNNLRNEYGQIISNRTQVMKINPEYSNIYIYDKELRFSSVGRLISVSGYTHSNESSTTLNIIPQPYFKSRVFYPNNTVFEYINQNDLKIISSSKIAIIVQIVYINKFGEQLDYIANILLNQPLQTYNVQIYNLTGSPVNNFTVLYSQPTTNNQGSIIYLNNSENNSIDLYNTSLVISLKNNKGVEIFITKKEIINTDINLYIDFSRLELWLYDTNTNTSFKFESQIHAQYINTSQIHIYTIVDEYYHIIPGKFNLTIANYLEEGIILDVLYSTSINITLPVRYSEFMYTLRILPEQPTRISIYHEILNYTYSLEYNIFEFSNTIIFPQGDIVVEIITSTIYIYKLTISESYSLQLAILEDEAINPMLIGEQYHRKSIEGRSFGVTPSTEFLSSYLEGSLIIINIILFAEILLVVLVSYFNASVLLRFVVLESKKEINVIQSVGYSDLATYFIFIKPFLFIGVLAATIGQFLSFFVIHFFIHNNTLVIFGRLFTPNVFHLNIFLGNLILIFFVLTISGFNSFQAYNKYK
jgi:ABC-type lipoprotein release transport system permease subunit